MNQRPVRFCPYCGVSVVSRYLFGQERPTCPQCGWIYFADPKVAAAAIVEEEGKILLTRRVNEPYQGYWTLPAGFVDAGEDPARAAERETFEETGLEVQVTELVEVISGREHERGADIVIVYRARRIGGTLRPGDDADRVGFFDREHFPPLAFRATRRALGVE